MFDSIFIGMSGLQSFSKGLKVISNNVANMNTPGFKASSLSFGDTYYQQQGVSGDRAGHGTDQFGTGVSTFGSFVDFRAGETRQTGNSLDMSIAGDGFFMLRDPKSGQLTYTRLGEFDFDSNGLLVQRGTTLQVQGFGTDGTLGPISRSGLQTSAPKPSAHLEFTGNLSSGVSAFTLESIKIIDSLGSEHIVKLEFKTKDDTPGVWTVKMVDGSTETDLGEIKFIDGKPDPAANALKLHYAPAGVAPFDVAFDFSQGITSFASGTISTLALAKNDGVLPGTLGQVTFDDSGVMTMQYSNGQEVSGPQLALARFDSTDVLEQTTGGAFTCSDPRSAQVARANTDGLGKIASDQIEGSNVDLSGEFSELILMQRGYQASSQIVSTANDMLRELFEMKGRG